LRVREGSRRTTIRAQRQANDLRRPFGNGLYPPMVVEIRCGIARVDRIHFDRRFAQFVGELHSEHIERGLRCGVAEILRGDMGPSWIGALRERDGTRPANGRPRKPACRSCRKTRTTQGNRGCRPGPTLDRGRPFVPRGRELQGAVLAGRRNEFRVEFRRYLPLRGCNACSAAARTSGSGPLAAAINAESAPARSRVRPVRADSQLKLDGVRRFSLCAGKLAPAVEERPPHPLSGHRPRPPVWLVSRRWRGDLKSVSARARSLCKSAASGPRVSH
jgi:hypothetical protein